MNTKTCGSYLILKRFCLILLCFILCYCQVLISVTELRGQKYSVSQITDLYFDPNCETLSQHYAVCCGAVLCDLIGFLTGLK